MRKLCLAILASLCVPALALAQCPWGSGIRTDVYELTIPNFLGDVDQINVLIKNPTPGYTGAPAAANATYTVRATYNGHDFGFGSCQEGCSLLSESRFHVGASGGCGGAVDTCGPTTLAAGATDEVWISPPPSSPGGGQDYTNIRVTYTGTYGGLVQAEILRTDPTSASGGRAELLDFHRQSCP